MCVRALSHAGAQGSARNYHWGRPESAVLDKILFWEDPVGPEWGEGAADGSLSQHSPLHLKLLPQKLPRWKWNGLKKEQNCPWGTRRRQKRMLRRVRKSQGAGRLSEGKDMTGRVPKILSVGGDFLCKFRWTERHLSMAGSLSAPYHCTQASLQSLSAKRGSSMNHLHWVVLLQTPSLQDTLWSRAAVLFYITSPLTISFVPSETLLIMIETVLF